ncbi:MULTISPECIES: sialate O-acetylesterase [unclassified Paraburkholderia]|uniref:sialate O-acetylesterase n=1 Tax=unclassified Paraburkholderia TaxID=2615204 RepID=UPI001FB88BD8|nr:MULTISPECIES: sialate O-acetylesterase [unclassified Paraburkholderia]
MPETYSTQVDGNQASVVVQNVDGRPGSQIRFTLTSSANTWAVQKVSAVSALATTTIFDATQPGSGDGRIEPAYSAWIPHGAAPWDITHVISYGQSLSQGFYNRPVLSTHQRYSSLRFNGGVRVQDSIQSGNVEVAYKQFVPLVETQWGDKAETPTSGTLNMAMQLIEQENLQNHADIPYRFVGSAPGEGSMAIATLSEPGRYYSQLLRDIAQAKRLADAEGKTYGIGAITWTQGEADDSSQTSIPTYVAKLRTLRADVDRDAKAMTGQKQDVEMITYQLATHRRFDQRYPHIALALLQASHEDPHIHLAVSMYLFRYIDGGHTDNRSTEWMGAYYGLVLKRILIDRATWKPLEPLSWQRDGTTATLRFNVPAPPLKWDTTQVAGNSDYGFSLRLPSGALLPIRSVAITGADEVEIIAQSPIPAGTHVEYAFNGAGIAGSRYGPRGNLRDSQGDAIRFNDGRESMRLDNWCVIFDVSL